MGLVRTRIKRFLTGILAAVIIITGAPSYLMTFKRVGIFHIKAVAV